VRRPGWIDQRDTLALYYRLLALEGGAAGMRDLGLLESALARPRQLRADGEKPDIMQMAAAYTAGIVRDHPFIDGNKRTGFVVGVLFLELNGCRFIASEEDAAQAVLSLASREMDEATFTAWMRANAKKQT
jgi:death on curing protein